MGNIDVLIQQEIASENETAANYGPRRENFLPRVPHDIKG